MKKYILKAFHLVLVAVIFAYILPVTQTKALTLEEIKNQAKVLGATTQNLYPYPSASLVNDGGAIYFISGSSKVPFASLSAFKGLGYSLKNVVKGSLQNYSLAQSYVISTANMEHPWGSWLSYKGTIYYFSQDGLIGVPSSAVFLSNGGQWSMVVKANKYDIATLQKNSNLPALTLNDSRVITSTNYQFSGSASVPSVQNSTPPSNPTVPSITQTQPPTVTTQIPNLIPGTLNTPKLDPSSPQSQFVFGGTQNQLIANYNFTASGSPVTIQELYFQAFSGGAPVTVNFVPLVSLTINNSVAGFGATTSTVAGLNIWVPTTGITIPVSVNYAGVGLVSDPRNVGPNQIFTLNLVGVKYLSGGVSSFIYPNVPSNPMNIVSAAPTSMSLADGDPLTYGTVMVSKVTVTNNSPSSLILNTLPLTISTVGNAFITATSGSASIRDDGGYPITNVPINVSVAAGGSGSFSLSFVDDNIIISHSSKTYDIYLPIQGAVGNTVGYSAVVTKLGDPAGLTFSDSLGNVVPGSSGGINFISNYQSTSSRSHN